MKNKLLNFGEAIKEATIQSMRLDNKINVFGLGVGKTTNINNTTSDLVQEFGKDRVFDTPCSESAVTAMGTGMAIAGLRPLLIHQRFDFMIYSLDQIVNWISLWSYKSAGKSNLPFTIRAIVGKGWGQGPQHGKSLHSWFSNLPGLSVLYPSSPFEAKGLLMSSLFANFPTIIFESRSLWSMKEQVPSKPYFIDPTKAFIRKNGKDLTIVSFGPSVHLALNVSEKLKKNKINAEVLDLRSLNPIDTKTIINSVKKTRSLAVIEHGWKNCGIASEIISLCSEKIKLKNKPLRFCWPDSHIPTSYKLEKQFYFDDNLIIKHIQNSLK